MSEELTQRWTEFARKIDIGGPMPVRFEFRPLPDNCSSDTFVNCITRVKTVERDGSGWLRRTHKETEVMVCRTVYGEPEIGQLRHIAQELYLHELDEWLMVDGVRVYDPHSGRPETA